MTADQQRFNEIRELLMNAPESWTTRTLAIAGSLLLAGVVLYLVRRRTLREEYTPIWLILALGTLVISVWRDALYALTRAVGAWTPSSMLFFFGEAFLIAICLNYAVRLSKLTLQVKNLSQELAILTARAAGETAQGDSRREGAKAP